LIKKGGQEELQIFLNEEKIFYYDEDIGELDRLNDFMSFILINSFEDISQNKYFSTKELQDKIEHYKNYTVYYADKINISNYDNIIDKLVFPEKIKSRCNIL